MVKARTVKKKEKRSELLGALVTPTVKAEVEEIVEREERTRSYVAGALIERGLAAYRKDRQLKPKVKDGKPELSPSNNHPVR